MINITAGGISGGYRKYLTRVLPRIATHRDVDRLLCAAPRTLGIRQWFDDALDVEFVETGSLKVIDNGLSLELKETLRRFGPDVIYVPVERCLRFDGVPVVHMLQNMEPLIRPFRGNPPKEMVKNFLRRRSAKRALENADRVVAMSEFVRNFIAARWKIPREKIGLIYHGIDGADDDESIQTLVGSLGTARARPIFTAGSVRPARGLEDVILALGHIRRDSGRAPVLVIAGALDPAMAGYQNRLKRQIEDMHLSANVKWAGQLNEEQMKWHYRNCSAFVMTSRVESFGHIAGEALSHGCLCISADNPCLPEVFGDAALYYQAGNAKALADVIETALSLDGPTRALFLQRAKERAGLFLWDVCAEKTVEELKKAVDRR
jgi:glycosyltransferase involved in cell wall biosynthesis